jgi:hypothetical protein
MNELHAALAKTLTQEVQEREVEYTETDGDGNEVKRVRVERPSASWAAVAAKFLKDNSVTMAPDDSNALGELEKELADMRKGRTGFTDQDLKDAHAALGSSLLQ